MAQDRHGPVIYTRVQPQAAWVSQPFQHLPQCCGRCSCQERSCMKPLLEGSPSSAYGRKGVPAPAAGLEPPPPWPGPAPGPPPFIPLPSFPRNDLEHEVLARSRKAFHGEREVRGRLTLREKRRPASLLQGEASSWPGMSTARQPRCPACPPPRVAACRRASELLSILALILVPARPCSPSPLLTSAGRTFYTLTERFKRQEEGRPLRGARRFARGRVVTTPRARVLRRRTPCHRGTCRHRRQCARCKGPASGAAAPAGALASGERLGAGAAPALCGRETRAQHRRGVAFPIVQPAPRTSRAHSFPCKTRVLKIAGFARPPPDPPKSAAKRGETLFVLRLMKQMREAGGPLQVCGGRRLL